MSVDSPGIVVAFSGSAVEQHKLRRPFVLHLREVLDVPQLPRHRNNNSKSPAEKDALGHSLSSSRFRGMTANILCQASSTWTTRHRLRGGVLKGARCICPYAAAELLAMPLGLATLAELRHQPALAPLHDIAQTRPGTVFSLEFTLTTNRCRSTELTNCNDPG